VTEAGLILFLAASGALILAPGPDNILVMTRGVTMGKRAALLSAVGASTGLLVHSLFAAVGLSALVAGSATAFSVVKYAGAAYLVYLGVRALMNREALVPSGVEPAVGMRQVYLQGVLTNVLNPKVALFFLAFLPQFVDSGVAAAPQLFTLGVAFACLGCASLSALALLCGNLGDWLTRRPRSADALRWLPGGVLIGLGLSLALPDRR
jgi:threonine/homoserine/homoserine lactone efflux protein